MTEATHSESGHLDDHHEGLEGGIGHVSPLSTLFMVIGALLCLTVITVGVAQIDLGQFNVVGAIAIASVKASIVLLFFMHLRYDNRFNFLIMVGSVAMAAWFVAYVLMDSKLYQANINDYLMDEAHKIEGDSDEAKAKRRKFTEQTK